MNNRDPEHHQKLERTQLIFYLIPILGVLPALWSLSRPSTDIQVKKISKLSVTLALSWFIPYILLWFNSSAASELGSFRFLYLNGLFTSGYFCLCFVLMVRLWRGKIPYLPNLRLFKSKKL